MSSKICDLYGFKAKNGQVGIEVEVEFKEGTLPMQEGIGCWRAVPDGSLKNGMEYITRQPIKVGSDKLGKIKDLTDALSEYKTVISPRCSIHVHRNVSEFTPIEIWNTIIAYWLLEAPILAFCGSHRRKNLFCLGLAEAPGILNRCFSDLSNSGLPFKSFKEGLCKYGGQNLSAIQKKGSLEYRGMRGTLDPDLIDMWSDVVYELGENARKFKDPSELMDFYLDSEKDQFLLRLLPKSFIDHLIKTEDYVSLIKKNALTLCDLAYYHNDWQAWQSAIKKPETPTSLGEVPLAFNYNTAQSIVGDSFYD